MSSNSVANKYRGYGRGSFFSTYNAKVAAQRELNQEMSRLQTEIDACENVYNGYQNNVMPYLTTICGDFDGFIINKMKNAKTSLDRGYEGDKSKDIDQTLQGYLGRLTSCKEQVMNLKSAVELRKREVSIRKRDYENQLSDVRSVANNVDDAMWRQYSEPGTY